MWSARYVLAQHSRADTSLLIAILGAAGAGPELLDIPRTGKWISRSTSRRRSTLQRARSAVSGLLRLQYAYSYVPCSGPNNDQLYVTSAHCGACGGDASRQVDYPDSGNLFVVDLSGAFSGGEWRFEFAG